MRWPMRLMLFGLCAMIGVGVLMLRSASDPRDVRNGASKARREQVSRRRAQEERALPIGELTEEARIAMRAARPAVCSHMQHGCLEGEVAVAVRSSKTHADVCVGGQAVFNATTSGRGLNVAVINERTGRVTAAQTFDTYGLADAGFDTFVQNTHSGRVVAVAAADDASFNLGVAGRKAAMHLGSVQVDSLNFRATWAFIGGGELTYEEALSQGHEYEFGEPVAVAACVPLKAALGGASDAQLQAGAAYTREQFCSEHDGYGEFCHDDFVHEPLVPLPLTAGAATDRSAATGLPVAIMAGNRPFYLQRCLSTLFQNPGLDPRLVTVFIDGVYEEPVRLAKLFGVHTVQHAKTRSTSQMAPTFKNADMIALHYKISLTKLMEELHPDAQAAIVVEEDLEVSPDFLSYFSQLMPLVQRDPTLLCVSAWNDNAYTYSSHDPALVYRTEFFPGLGWMLTRALYNEIMPKWPQCCGGWSWDLWLRGPENTRGRECLIPDVPRTFHIGQSGLNVNTYFFRTYFQQHALNTRPDVTLSDLDRLGPAEYDAHLHALVARATPLDHARSGGGKTPCDAGYVPTTVDRSVFVIFYEQKDADDTSSVLKIASCFKLWDLGIRGLHKTVLRFFHRSNHILAVGSKSEFAQHMPPNIEPLNLADRDLKIPLRE